MKTLKISMAAWSVALLLAGCGGGDSGGPAGVQVSNPTRGQLMQNPPLRVVSLSPADFTAMLNASSGGPQLLALAGAPQCGIDIHYLRYGTVGGNGESTTATGALMVPTGTAAGCTGARPIVEYAHGTNITKRYNIADLTDHTNPAFNEASLLAALYAAQGYIVVAPNYAGYDASTLPYHPYVNADQQSKDMIDALAAAKAALPGLLNPVTASTRLFLTGYSQGGYVAMATQRALESATPPVTVTAAAPMSGPYALTAYLDAIFGGTVPIGATAFAPLLVNSYKNSYPTANPPIYTALTDIYTSTYATGIDFLVPGVYDFNTVFPGKLPPSALFSSNLTPPPFGFAASNYLIADSYRAGYLADMAAHADGLVPTPTTALPNASAAHPMRAKAVVNDLRGFFPTAPVLLCGGYNDPTVFYPVNTQAMTGIWTAAAAAHPNMHWQVLNLESTSCSSSCAAGTAASTSTFAASAVLNPLFQAAVTATFTGAGGGAAGQQAVAVAYHGTLVPPYCNKAAKIFFDAQP